LQWWNIADANPAFLSPLALIGKDAVVTTRFPLNVTAAPLWTNLFVAVRAVLGVEDVEMEENVQLVPQQVTVSGQTITAIVEKFSWAVLVTYNRLNVTAATLATAIEAAGSSVMPFVEVSQLGQEIIIPPKPIG
jgi:hypothetical protein